MEKLLKSEGMAFKVVLIKIIPYQINKINMMKKVMYVCLMVAMMPFVSCDSDDDSPQDTIIGKWQLEQRFKNNVEESLSDDCEKKSTIEFKTDNTFNSFESFFEPDQPCISSTVPGTWEYNGDNALKTSYDGKDKVVVDLTYTFVDGKLNVISGNIKNIWNRVN